MLVLLARGLERISSAPGERGKESVAVLEKNLDGLHFTSSIGDGVRKTGHHESQWGTRIYNVGALAPVIALFDISEALSELVGTHFQVYMADV